MKNTPGARGLSCGAQAQEAAIGEHFLMVRLATGEAHKHETALARLEELVEQRDFGEVEATLNLPSDETVVMIATKARDEVELEEVWVPRLRQLLESLGLQRLATVEIPLEDDNSDLDEKWNEFDISAAEAAAAPEDGDEVLADDDEPEAVVTEGEEHEEPEEFETPITNVAGWRDEAALHPNDDDEPPSRRRR
jgi:hypothetical protein